MQVGLTEAARLTGKDASTITRACQAGRLSFQKDDAGARVFDIAELERWAGKLRNPDDAPTSENALPFTAVHDAEIRAKDAEIDGLRREIRRLEEALEDARHERSRWQEQAGQITRLLTDQRAEAERERNQRDHEHQLSTLTQRLKFILTGKVI